MLALVKVEVVMCSTSIRGCGKLFYLDLSKVIHFFKAHFFLSSSPSLRTQNHVETTRLIGKGFSWPRELWLLVNGVA